MKDGWSISRGGWVRVLRRNGWVRAVIVPEIAHGKNIGYCVFAESPYNGPGVACAGYHHTLEAARKQAHETTRDWNKQ